MVFARALVLLQHRCPGYAGGAWGKYTHLPQVVWRYLLDLRFGRNLRMLTLPGISFQSTYAKEDIIERNVRLLTDMMTALRKYSRRVDTNFKGPGPLA